MSATPIQSVDETVLPPRRALPVFDPLLLLAGAGLAACSYAILNSSVGRGTADRQAIYAGVGVLLALGLSRIDYSRLRALKRGLLAVMIALNLVVYGMPRIQGAHRWIPLPLMNFQSSEFGKILLI
ncbi:MAG: FtsW/RodA/SpoVE family cell cycle protein, partial [Solirubrobacteraceae bacterium]